MMMIRMKKKFKSESQVREMRIINLPVIVKKKKSYKISPKVNG
jgi:hypothetical protein